MNVKIKPISESPFTYEEVVKLMHESFEERVRQGLEFTCSTMTVDSYKKRTQNGIVLVAWDADSNDLLGTATVTLRTDKKSVIYGYNENLAISPRAKRLGIGTRLLEECINIIANAGGQYIMSDTAVGADSSIKWHLKNGFRIIGLRSFPSTNYYSYIFRKQLIPSKLWDSHFYTSLRFNLSSIIIKSIYHADGSLKTLGKITKSILR